MQSINNVAVGPDTADRILDLSHLPFYLAEPDRLGFYDG